MSEIHQDWPKPKTQNQAGHSPRLQFTHLVTRYYQRRRLNSLQQKGVAVPRVEPAVYSRQAQIVAKGASKFECP